MGTETELKFRLPARRLQTLMSGPIPGARAGKRRQLDLTTTYFDTVSHKLQRKGLSLRVRHSGKTWLQTVKTASTTATRGEWETEIDGSGPDLSKVDGTPLRKLASRKLCRKLQPVFVTTVHRMVVPVRLNDCDIELAVDRGRIVAGRRASPIAEVEIELLRGRPDGLFQLARIIATHAMAELYLPTKSERGYALSRGESAGESFARPIVLDDDMAVDDGFRIIARACVRHFAGNADAVRRGDAEGIHQMRVGLRRLRAAISLFSDRLPGAETERIKAECKWLTDALGPAREIDVFLKGVAAPASRTPARRRGRKALETEFAARRARAVGDAVRVLESVRFRALLVDLLAWIEEQRGNDKAIGKVAARILRRRVKQARRQGRHLADLSARDRHKYRLRIKKLRYAVEFFGGLFPDQPARRRLKKLSARLNRIQDSLGAMNDLVTHQKLVAEAASQAPRQHRRARASGVIVGSESKLAARLLREAVDDIRMVRRLKLG